MNIGIYGYGNLGRGVELAAQKAGETIVGIFSRRDPQKIKTVTGAPVYSSRIIDKFTEKIDVLAVCGGSAADLPEMTPQLAQSFNVVDSYDNHGEMKNHVTRVDEAARASGHTAIVGCGWDPGLFSLVRLYFSAFFPGGNVTTFWGRGVSQGHSEAVRRIDGVLDARQYTVPNEDVLALVREGKLSPVPEKLHRREVYVVPKENADCRRIVKKILSLEGYFKGYDTSVKFISSEEMAEKHNSLSHGGGVIALNRSGERNEHINQAELTLSLDSNPEFTGGIMLAYMRAALKINSRGEYGAKTVFDVPARDVYDMGE